MGTRADFYVGRGEQAEWLGSIAWDGYPNGIPARVLTATDEEDFRTQVEQMLKDRDDGTLPEMGWPWPWEDSRTTDYAYAFQNGVVYRSCFGGEWELATAFENEEEYLPKTATFPNMKDRQAVTLGARSGVIVITK